LVRKGSKRESLTLSKYSPLQISKAEQAFKTIETGCDPIRTFADGATPPAKIANFLLTWHRNEVEIVAGAHLG
jgi:hypothetical protein